MFERGEQQSRHETPVTTRRTMLRAAGLLGLTGAGAAVLGACAEESSGSPSVTPAAPETSAAASPSPAADATSPKPSASKAKAPSGPSVATSEVPVGGGVILENAEYVVTNQARGLTRPSGRSAPTRDARWRQSKTVSFTATATAVNIRSRTALSGTHRPPRVLPMPRPSSRRRST